jgi:cytochrome P450
MFEYLSAPGDGPRPLTEYELIADSGLLIAAGAVSTALSITFIFYHLCQNRAQIKRLQAEIDSCWAGQSALEVGKLSPNIAPYLEGVINESLRLWPPAPNGMQRRTPAEGVLIDEMYVPGNTQVSVHTMAIARDSRYFSRPQEFIPERWIDGERPKDFNHNTRAFIPFTVGQYACLGKNLAYQEIRLFMAKVVRNFDFEFASGYEPVIFEKNIRYKGTLLIEPLMLKLSKRK